MTVQQFRNTGYKVRVLHCRLYKGVELSYSDLLSVYRTSIKPKPDAKGGSTQVIIDSPDGKHFIGEAICSKKENYNKKMGVRIALGRSGVFSK
jgi:hypothetical protein